MPVGLRTDRHRFVLKTKAVSLMRTRVAVLCCIGVVSTPISGLSAQQFSASVITTNSTAETTTEAGRVLVADGKVRLELPDFPDGYFIVNPAANSAFFVRPGKRVFMEARQSSRLAQILVAVDPEDPCQQWQEVAVITGAANPGRPWQCARSKVQSADARGMMQYEVTAPDAHRYEVWIDPKIKFPVRIRAEIGTAIEVTNIQEGPQPETAFELPPGFGKFDPQGLIDRIKQSDVWVQPAEPE
jgi:hypothetical protein